MYFYQLWKVGFPPYQQLNLKIYEISMIKGCTYFLPVGLLSGLISPLLSAEKSISIGADVNEYGPVNITFISILRKYTFISSLVWYLAPSRRNMVSSLQFGRSESSYF